MQKMNDSEILCDSEQDVSKHHSKLIKAVAELDKEQRMKKAERTEPSVEISEYHLVKSGIQENAVHMRDLLRSLRQKGYQRDLSKKLRAIRQKAKIFSAPLEKPSAERIKRTIGFENVKKELGKWNAVITRNRTAEQLFFPLSISKQMMKDTPTIEFLKRFKMKSDLQKKLEKLDPQLQEDLIKEKDKYQMTLEEVILKRKEIAKFRAQQSYKEAKAHYQRKIKSKKYHHIQRKQKIKQQLKEFEQLQKTNPKEALAKLEQLNKIRAKERMSLRHKGMSQWAKNKEIRAKYDKETRQVLAEQLAVGRELMQKVIRTNDSDDENEQDTEPLVLFNNDKENPWVNGIKTESEIDKFVKGCRKYWNEKSKKSEKKKVIENNSRQELSVGEYTDDRLKEFMDNKLEKQNSDKLNQTNNIVNSIITSASCKNIKESSVTEKEDEITNTHNTIIFNDKLVYLSKKRKVKLYNRKSKTIKKNLYDADATSLWYVEELQCNDKTNPKISNLQNIEDLFDTMEEKLKYEANSKLQNVKNKLIAKSKIKKQDTEYKENEDYSLKLDEFKEFKQKPILDLPLKETTSSKQLLGNLQDTNQINLKIAASIDQEYACKSNLQVEINPHKYLNIIPKHLKTQLPDMEIEGEDALDNSEQEEMHKIMSEAFVNDDVVEKFRKEKEMVKKSQSENIDLSLPGWGYWAGVNISNRKMNRKKKRFILRFPEEIARKNESKGHIIIFENDNQKLKEHLISELPYPFTTVKDFEASLRTSLGRTFIPENAHTRLIQPAVVTKHSKVIEPMTEDMLVKKQPILKRRIHNNKNVKNNIKKCK